MSSPSTPVNKLNRAVVAFLDGRRLKGFLFNFSALRDSFHLFPDETVQKEGGTDVHMRDLKAVFFVKDFKGNPASQESASEGSQQHGRKIEITFIDGERLTGTTEGYNPQKLGFFVFPADASSNNMRVFIVNKNVLRVKML
jgi:hypothetical protein